MGRHEAFGLFSISLLIGGPSHVPTSRVFAYETSQQYRVDIRKKASSDISNKLLSILHYGFIK